MKESLHTIKFDDVADLYDYYVNVNFDLPFYLSEAGKAGGKVLELTCGTGRISIPLLQAGIDLTCIDYSHKMLGVFRKKLAQTRLSCNIIQMDMTHLALRKHFDLILLPFHSFSEVVDTSKHLPTLKLIYKHLREHGTFICTLQNPVVQIKTFDGEQRTIGKFQMDSGSSLVVKMCFTYDSLTQIVHGYQLYEIYDPEGMLTLNRRLDIRFYLFMRREIEELFYKAGFAPKALFGDYQYAPFRDEISPYMIWRLKPRL